MDTRYSPASAALAGMCDERGQRDDQAADNLAHARLRSIPISPSNRRLWTETCCGGFRAAEVLGCRCGFADKGLPVRAGPDSIFALQRIPAKTARTTKGLARAVVIASRPLVLALAIATGLSGCGRSGAPPAPPVPKVPVITVASATCPSTASGWARPGARPTSRSARGCPASSRPSISRRAAAVKAGDLLYSIDPSELEQNRAAAQAERAQAETLLRRCGRQPGPVPAACRDERGEPAGPGRGGRAGRRRPQPGEGRRGPAARGRDQPGLCQRAGAHQRPDRHLEGQGRRPRGPDVGLAAQHGLGHRRRARALCHQRAGVPGLHPPVRRRGEAGGRCQGQSRCSSSWPTASSTRSPGA